MAARSEENICYASDEIAATEKLDFIDSRRYLQIVPYYTVLSFLVRGLFFHANRNICVMIAKKTVNSIFCEGTCTLHAWNVGILKIAFSRWVARRAVLFGFFLIIEIKCEWNLSLLVDISRLCVSLLLNCLQFGFLATVHLLNRAVFWWKWAIREQKGNTDSDAREF